MKLTTFEAVRSWIDKNPPRRILLVHPTKYLGNLLISGHVIQQFALWCKAANIELAVILDQQYEDVFASEFSDAAQIYWYPRKRFAEGNWFNRFFAYLAFIRQIRRFRADLALNLEADSPASLLLRLSGAGFKLGSSQERHKRGYDAVLPLEINKRPENEAHRWYSYREVFSVFGGFESYSDEAPKYLNINNNNNEIESGINLKCKNISAPLIVIHPGGTKMYKRWPDENFTVLCQKLLSAGAVPVLIGAGNADTEAVNMILTALNKEGLADKCLNLCNQLNLNELKVLFRRSAAMVGNDSGPFHLASALDLPGVVLFGPTETAIWGPLGENSYLMHNKQACLPDCTRHHCTLNYHCLASVSPDEVFNKIQEIQRDGGIN
jgi:heptosyltransferase-3